MTADGLFSAIRKVLNSISGKFPELYPQLESILEQAISVALSDNGADNADEALTCVAELLYNQKQVSERMWGVYFHIVNLYLNDQGVIEAMLGQASVPLINYMVKAPEIFKNQDFGGQGTPLTLLLSYIAKTFNDGEELCDENLTMTGISLIMACLEHLGEGMGQIIHQINGFYLKGI